MFEDLMLPKIHITIERWKFNREFNVWVSTQGRVKSKNKEIIKPKINNNGYMFIFTRNKVALVHRLVMLTYFPIEDSNAMTVDHLDHNKRNNSVKNLEWVTWEENLRRAKVDQTIENKVKYKTKHQKREELIKGPPIYDRAIVIHKIDSNRKITFCNIKEALKFVKTDKHFHFEKDESDESIEHRLHEVCLGRRSHKYFGYVWNYGE